MRNDIFIKRYVSYNSVICVIWSAIVKQTTCSYFSFFIFFISNVLPIVTKEVHSRERITVIKFGVGDKGSNGTGS